MTGFSAQAGSLVEEPAFFVFSSILLFGIVLALFYLNN
jgi:hypothetical protein